MTDWFVAPFADNPFMTRALLAGVLVAAACGVVGVLVVLRGLAFLGDALAHGVLPGVAGATLLGLPGVLGAAAGAAVMIGGVHVVTRRSRLSGDTAVGLLFVGMLALGVVMVSRSDQFSGDVVGILFGEVLGVSWADLVQESVALAVLAATAVVCARPFLLLALDPDQADTAGWPARRLEIVMLVMVAIAVVTSFRTVGTLLVFGMLVAPAASAALMAHRLTTMTLWAVGIGAVSVYLGLVLSYHFDLAGSATVVVVATAVFFAVLTGRELHRAFRGATVDDDRAAEVPA